VIVDRAPLDCPACGHHFLAEWPRKPGEAWTDDQSQECPICRYSWLCAWPGFRSALGEITQWDGTGDLRMRNADVRP